MILRTVKLTSRNLHRLNVREWGLPTGCYIGRMWRSEQARTATCLLPIPGDPAHLRTETRAVLIVDHHEEQWMPATWKAAARVRRKDNPSTPRLWRVP